MKKQNSECSYFTEFTNSLLRAYDLRMANVRKYETMTRVWPAHDQPLTKLRIATVFCKPQ